jgi:hypothetical protein
MCVDRSRSNPQPLLLVPSDLCNVVQQPRVQVAEFVPPPSERICAATKLDHRSDAAVKPSSYTYPVDVNVYVNVHKRRERTLPHHLDHRRFRRQPVLCGGPRGANLTERHAQKRPALPV